MKTAKKTTKAAIVAQALDMGAAADHLAWTLRAAGQEEEAARWEERASRCRAVATKNGVHR